MHDSFSIQSFGLKIFPVILIMEQNAYHFEFKRLFTL